jgi:hypothetical protein
MDQRTKESILRFDLKYIQEMNFSTPPTHATLSQGWQIFLVLASLWRREMEVYVGTHSTIFASSF